MQILAAAILVVVFGGICWSLLNPPAEFVIRWSHGRARFRGRIPAARRTEIEEFLLREFPNAGTITISGLKDRGGRPRLTVRGPLSDGDRQRIRNFLQTVR